MRIRLAAATDAAEVARLTTLLGYPASTEEVERRLTVLMPSSAHFIAVAEGSTGLVGWVAAEKRVLLESGERAELVGLIVDPQSRRSGIGRALVRAAEDWAVAQKVDVITVRSNVTRLESHPFYEGLGYVRRKTQHAYVKQLRAR